jgi:hypothetical protein
MRNLTLGFSFLSRTDVLLQINFTCGTNTFRGADLVLGVDGSKSTVFHRQGRAFLYCRSPSSASSLLCNGLGRFLRHVVCFHSLFQLFIHWTLVWVLGRWKISTPFYSDKSWSYYPWVKEGSEAETNSFPLCKNWHTRSFSFFS